MKLRDIAVAAAAVAIVAGAGGFGLARLTGGEPSQEAASEEAGHEGEEHAKDGSEGWAEAEEGFVALTPNEAQAAGVTVVSLLRGGGQEIRLAGRVEPQPSARAAVAAPLGGSVERVHVAPGSYVRAGAPIATLRSGEGAVLRAEAAVGGSQAASARAEAQAAAAAFAREDRLLKEGIVARQDWEAVRATMLKAQAEVRAADAQSQAARARIAAAGSPGASGRMTVVSPISGVITAMQTAAGGFVAQGGTVAEVTNPNLVELVFTAPAMVAGRITPGMQIVAQGPEGTEYRAVVTGVAPDAVEASGAAVVRARPTGLVPAPGAPLSGRVVVSGSGAITVPTDAVQTVEGRTAVFVAEARGFRARPVLTGRTANGQVEILRGLEGSERVAGRGAFLLKAELAKGEAEHGH